MSTPELHLVTSYVLNADGRIVSTREPGGTRGPLLTVIRGLSSCAWAVREDVPPDLCRELDLIARDEPPAVDLHDPPVHAQRYLSVLAGRVAAVTFADKFTQSDGPAFSFPDSLPNPGEVAVVEGEDPLAHHFRGWVPGEIAAGRAPVLAVLDQGRPVSVCFCARRSEVAAEAGLETAEAYRRRGFGARVTAAWALAIRASGLIPLYSTAWTNHGSRGVARRLNLEAFASSWSLYD
jgi:hypothetical protein